MVGSRSVGARQADWPISRWTLGTWQQALPRELPALEAAAVWRLQG
jgi:hypothetical protein